MNGAISLYIRSIRNVVFILILFEIFRRILMDGMALLSILSFSVRHIDISSHHLFY